MDKNLKYLAIAAIAVVLLVPGLLTSIGAMIGGQLQNCNDAPFATNCFCSEGFNKQPTSIPFKVYCESDDLMFDPEDPEFGDDTVAFAKQYLAETYPDCDSINCPEPAVLTVPSIALTPDRRDTLVECRDTEFNMVRWSVLFSLEDGTVDKAECHNIFVPDPTETERREQFLELCNASEANEYCRWIDLATTSSCSVQEGRYPDGLYKGVGYNFNSWKARGYPTGENTYFCGAFAAQAWEEQEQ